MSYPPQLASANAIRPVNRWMPIMAVSLLLHLIVIFGIRIDLWSPQKVEPKPYRPITVTLEKTFIQSKPVTVNENPNTLTQQKPVRSHEKEPLPSTIPAQKQPVNSPKTLHSAKNSPITPHRTAEEPSARKSPMNATMQANQLPTNAAKTQAKPSPAKDWNAIAKDVIRENVENETSRNQRQGELSITSPSDMYGKPRDYFDRQDKQAMLADAIESNKKSIFANKKQKGEGQVIKLGKLCFHRPTFAEEEDIRAGGTIIGMLIPVSCDF